MREISLLLKERNIAYVFYKSASHRAILDETFSTVHKTRLFFLTLHGFKIMRLFFLYIFLLILNTIFFLSAWIFIAFRNRSSLTWMILFSIFLNIVKFILLNWAVFYIFSLMSFLLPTAKQKFYLLPLKKSALKELNSNLFNDH